MSICPIEGCRNYRYPGNYLCAAHWRRLPLKTKQALRRKDNHATARLRLLWEAIDEGMPLNRIYIVDPAEAGAGRRNTNAGQGAGEMMTREEFLADVPANLETLRTEALLTKKALSEKVGVSLATLVQIEAGTYRTQRPITLQKIIQFFELKPAPVPDPVIEKPPSKNDVQKLSHEVGRLADAAEMLTRQFVRVLEGLAKVEQHDQALDNLAEQIAHLGNGNGKGRA